MSLPDGPDLPAQFQGAYESARIKTERRGLDFAEAVAHGGNLHVGIAGLAGAEAALEAIFTYCEQARNACRTGQWSVTQMRKAVESALGPYAGSVKGDPRWNAHLDESAVLAEAAAGAPSERRNGVSARSRSTAREELFREIRDEDGRPHAIENV